MTKIRKGRMYKEIKADDVLEKKFGNLIPFRDQDYNFVNSVILICINYTCSCGTHLQPNINIIQLVWGKCP